MSGAQHCCHCSRFEFRRVSVVGECCGYVTTVSGMGWLPVDGDSATVVEVDCRIQVGIWAGIRGCRSEHATSSAQMRPTQDLASSFTPVRLNGMNCTSRRQICTLAVPGSVKNMRILTGQHLAQRRLKFEQ